MEYFVYSRHAIEALPPHDVPHVIISITTRADDVARIKTGPSCLGVLRLVFVDQDTASPEHPERPLFTRAHARQIWELLRAHHGRARRVVAHCDVGFSRSPAVAAAIASALGDGDAQFFRRYRPNMLVYRTLLETFHDEYAPYFTHQGE